MLNRAPALKPSLGPPVTELTSYGSVANVADGGDGQKSVSCVALEESLGNNIHLRRSSWYSLLHLIDTRRFIVLILYLLHRGQ